MLVKSITLKQLIDNLQTYMDTHPGSEDYQVYFDALHIHGKIDRYYDYNILELY